MKIVGSTPIYLIFFSDDQLVVALTVVGHIIIKKIYHLCIEYTNKQIRIKFITLGVTLGSIRIISFNNFFQVFLPLL